PQLFLKLTKSLLFISPHSVKDLIPYLTTTRYQDSNSITKDAKGNFVRSGQVSFLNIQETHRKLTDNKELKQVDFQLKLQEHQNTKFKLADPFNINFHSKVDITTETEGHDKETTQKFNLDFKESFLSSGNAKITLNGRIAGDKNHKPSGSLTINLDYPERIFTILKEHNLTQENDIEPILATLRYIAKSAPLENKITISITRDPNSNQIKVGDFSLREATAYLAKIKQTKTIPHLPLPNSTQPMPAEPTLPTPAPDSSPINSIINP
ncbi:MAG: DUF2125 domain-containing protein, partial [Burkholderiales bacterium]